jgi:hypothetical protein
VSDAGLPQELLRSLRPDRGEILERLQRAAEVPAGVARLRPEQTQIGLADARLPCPVEPGGGLGRPAIEEGDQPLGDLGLLGTHVGAGARPFEAAPDLRGKFAFSGRVGKGGRKFEQVQPAPTGKDAHLPAGRGEDFPDERTDPGLFKLEITEIGAGGPQGGDEIHPHRSSGRIPILHNDGKRHPVAHRAGIIQQRPGRTREGSRQRRVDRRRSGAFSVRRELRRDSGRGVIALDDHRHPVGGVRNDCLDDPGAFRTIEFVKLATERRRADGGRARRDGEIHEPRQCGKIHVAARAERRGQDGHDAPNGRGRAHASPATIPPG